MKKQVLFLMVAMFALQNYIFAAENSVQVVDLQKLVSNSSLVKQLKQEHSKKMVHNRQIAKISEKKRQSARNTLKQQIYKEIDEGQEL